MTSFKKLAGPTVWDAGSLRHDQWLLRVNPDSLHELSNIVGEIARAGTTVDTVTAGHFRAEALQLLARHASSMLDNGPGFAVIRGLPVAEWNETTASIALWGLGTLLGSPRPQNIRGDRVKLVMRAPAQSKSDSESARRGAKSDQEIGLHTENARPPFPPRIIGLLCLRPAAAGGDSLVMSGHSIYNSLLSQHDSVLQRLFGPFHYGRSPEIYPDGKTYDEDQVFSHRDDTVRVRYNRYWMELGHNDAGQPIAGDALTREALDAFEAALADGRLLLAFPLIPGDLFLVNNYVALHGRAAFTDGADPSSRRCLVRLWVD